MTKKVVTNELIALFKKFGWESVAVKIDGIKFVFKKEYFHEDGTYYYTDYVEEDFIKKHTLTEINNFLKNGGLSNIVGGE